MGKRFTEISKWTNNTWYRNLPPLYKLFWNYLCDMCDNVGVWYEDIAQASFHIGEEIDKDKALKLFNGRVILFPNKKDDEIKWFLKEFCDFQYGELKEDTTNKAHISYINTLKKHGLWKGHTGGINVPQEKEKDTEKEKDKVKEKEKKEIAPFVKLTEKEHEKLVKDFGEDIAQKAIDKMSTYKGANPKKRKYESDYMAILNWVIKEVSGLDPPDLRVKIKAEQAQPGYIHHQSEGKVYGGLQAD